MNLTNVTASDIYLEESMSECFCHLHLFSPHVSFSIETPYIGDGNRYITWSPALGLLWYAGPLPVMYVWFSIASAFRLGYLSFRAVHIALSCFLHLFVRPQTESFLFVLIIQLVSYIPLFGRILELVACSSQQKCQQPGTKYCFISSLIAIIQVISIGQSA